MFIFSQYVTITHLHFTLRPIEASKKTAAETVIDAQKIKSWIYVTASRLYDDYSVQSQCREFKHPHLLLPF